MIIEPVKDKREMGISTLTKNLTAITASFGGGFDLFFQPYSIPTSTIDGE